MSGRPTSVTVVLAVVEEGAGDGRMYPAARELQLHLGLPESAPEEEVVLLRLLAVGECDGIGPDDLVGEAEAARVDLRFRRYRLDRDPHGTDLCLSGFLLEGDLMRHEGQVLHEIRPDGIDDGGHAVRGGRGVALDDVC